MTPWRRAYPREKVAKLNRALARGFNTKLSDQDVDNALQRSTSFSSFAKNLNEMYSLSVELDQVIALCNAELT